MAWLVDIWETIIRFAGTVGIVDVIDLVVVAFLLYKGIMLCRETQVGQLLKGILLILVLIQLAELLRLNTINFILRNAMQIGLFAIVVIFQPELRRIVERVGRSRLKSFDLFSLEDPASRLNRMRECIDGVSEAAEAMSALRIGALIVFERETNLGEIAKAATVLNADPSPKILRNIFFPKSPLHDGAVIIRDARIFAAGCVLPNTRSNEKWNGLGTRHRAAVGISEESDAAVVVVSEETGIISVAASGTLERNLNRESLAKLLEEMLIPEKEKKQRRNSRKAAGNE